MRLLYLVVWYNCLATLGAAVTHRLLLRGVTFYLRVFLMPISVCANNG